MLIAETPSPGADRYRPGRIAPENTVQHAFELRDGQFVVRTGKMVHPDKPITSLSKRYDRLPQNIQFLLRAA